MGILTNLILSVLNLVFIAIDILIFFLIARIACYRWNPPWLRAIDYAGDRLIGWFTEYVRKAVGLVTNKIYSPRMILIIGMIALIFARFLLVALFSK